LGLDALLDFRMDVTLDGESLSAAEIKRLLAHSDGLALIRGKWVEIDHEGLRRTLDKFEAIERRAASDGLSFGEAMRMLAGAGIAENDPRRASRYRPGPGCGRSLAGGDAGGVAPPRRARPDRAREIPSRHIAALSTGRCAMALFAHPAQARSLPCRRHGSRQDHSGLVAAADAGVDPAG
jgi:hypothetical protein